MPAVHSVFLRIAEQWDKSLGAPGPPHAIKILKQLQGIKAPLIVQKIVYLITSNTDLDFTIEVDSLETFAGVGEHTKAKKTDGLRALRFEIEDDYVFQNILTDEGFLTLVYMALCIRDGCIAFRIFRGGAL